jgi:hypothetical protein
MVLNAAQSINIPSLRPGKAGFNRKLLLLSGAGAVSFAAAGSMLNGGLHLLSLEAALLPLQLAAALYGMKAFGRDRTPGPWDQVIPAERQGAKYL